MSTFNPIPGSFWEVNDNVNALLRQLAYTPRGTFEWNQAYHAWRDEVHKLNKLIDSLKPKA